LQINEPVDRINSQLKDEYGTDIVTGAPIWRVVWSEDQFEHRLGTYEDITPAGIYLRTVTEVRKVPKYRQWIRKKYVLEQLVLVPEQNREELPDVKISYEPYYVFETRTHKYLPPKYDVAKIIIDAVNIVKSMRNPPKEKDPEAGLTIEQQREKKTAEISKIQSELFENETDIGDALAHGEAVIVPRNYEKKVM